MEKVCIGFLKKGQNFRYLLRYKEGSIPQISEEYRKLKELEKNRQEIPLEDGISWYNTITGIDYEGYSIKLVEYRKKRKVAYKKWKKRKK